LPQWIVNRAIDGHGQVFLKKYPFNFAYLLKHNQIFLVKFLVKFGSCWSV